jgi:hypothetical protein
LAFEISANDSIFSPFLYGISPKVGFTDPTFFEIIVLTDKALPIKPLPHTINRFFFIDDD